MLCCIEGKADGEKENPDTPPLLLAFNKTQTNKTIKSKAQTKTGWNLEILITSTDAHRTLDKNNSSSSVFW